ncbi:FadR/GntR family transcriptional regulator [Dongia soli]|uniref:FadR/GntR family transcriptional regulator n=1 Tax=Dongia soli TaxID=600628 RepID=A0ABU5E7G0_9PROT|nr:FadR/GntR family transcriptional regulator [Dongia soli]MDY0882252.1 FadR/GntR family transcriptional regulator [Dongia soli]
MALSAATRSSLVDHATASLRAEIASGRWAIGDRIPPEAKLSDMLQVSRGTLREAVRVLSAAGLLEVRQGDGTYVRNQQDQSELLRRLNHADLHHHFEVRCMLEVQAAGLAAQRHTASDLIRLQQLLAARNDRLSDDNTASVDAFVARDYAFHEAVIVAAHNPALLELYRLFSDTIRRHMPATVGNAHLPEPDDAAHRAIVTAIAARNPLAAEAAARNIIAPILTALENLLATPAGGAAFDQT